MSKQSFDVVVNHGDLVEAGYRPSVAAALVGRGVSVGELPYLTTEELFDHWLEWNGIIGWTRAITAALDNLRNMEAL